MIRTVSLASSGTRRRIATRHLLLTTCWLLKTVPMTSRLSKQAQMVRFSFQHRSFRKTMTGQALVQTNGLTEASSFLLRPRNVIAKALFSILPKVSFLLKTAQKIYCHPLNSCHLMVRHLMQMWKVFMELSPLMMWPMKLI